MAISNKQDIGVIVGRFQVPKLTSAHRRLLSDVIRDHDKVIIFLGVAPTLGTKHNPLDYPTRVKMLKETINVTYHRSTQDSKTILIAPLMDNPSDLVWSENLDSFVRSHFSTGSVCLYGGRDSFIKSYKTKTFSTKEMSFQSPESGTELRKIAGKEILNSDDFRSGIIYAIQNRFPVTYPTVDLAVLKDNKYVLMGKKKNVDGWCFPGGFADPHDESYETAAIREFHEEIGGVEIGLDLEYISSHIVDDWRYKDEEKIKTILFATDYIFGDPTVKEELIDLQWVNMTNTKPEDIAKAHKPLYKSLIKYVNGRIK